MAPFGRVFASVPLSRVGMEPLRSSGGRSPSLRPTPGMASCLRWLGWNLSHSTLEPVTEGLGGLGSFIVARPLLRAQALSARAMANASSAVYSCSPEDG
eukprot:1480582-Heterocapsa_arctica.AAC.1